MPLPEYQIRDLAPAETSIIGDTLYRALDWNPDKPIPVSLTQLLEHPELTRYHLGWGRPGDIAVVAALVESVIGAAFCRLFTDDDHGEGYLDSETPELAVAVMSGHRGRGVGTQLLLALEDRVRAAGFARLSLSVDDLNPAAHLYARVGYRQVPATKGLMVKDLVIDDSAPVES